MNWTGYMKEAREAREARIAANKPMENNNEFRQWVCAELAELEAPMKDGGIWSGYLSDRVWILKHALRHGDENKYLSEMENLINLYLDAGAVL